jgi:hypothetical protein
VDSSGDDHNAVRQIISMFDTATQRIVDDRGQKVTFLVVKFVK